MTDTVTEAEVQRFAERRKEFVRTHSDYDAVLQRAHDRKLDLTQDAVREIVRIGRPDVVYTLALEENESEARMINGIKGEHARDMVRRIASRNDRHGRYRTTAPKENPEEVAVAAYLRGRHYDLAQGLRRRR